ncbi:MAG: sugar phosphate isomerase/epimerase family protein [Desulfobacterales bacterium]|jgi:sugar phosphate isomerase/epimerase
MKNIQTLLKNIQINMPFSMLFDTYLDKFVQHGLNPEIGIDAATLERFSNAEFLDVAETLHNHGLITTLHGPYIDLSAGSTDPAVRALTRRRFEQVLDLIPVFKPKSVVYHAGYDAKRYGYFRDVWVENCLEIWTWLANLISEKGSQLMLENVYEKQPEDMLIIFEKLQRHRVGFCLDTGHLTAFGNSDLASWLTCLGSYLGQLHLHDNHGKNDEHLAMGNGTIDFDVLFDYLKNEVHPQPIITIEPHTESDLWQSLAYLAKRWPWKS